MGAVCEFIDTPPIIVFPFGTSKEEIEEWEKDGFIVEILSEEETKREKEIEEKRNKEK
jgi:hypothetical protein